MKHTSHSMMAQGAIFIAQGDYKASVDIVVQLQHVRMFSDQGDLHAILQYPFNSSTLTRSLFLCSCFVLFLYM